MVKVAHVVGSLNIGGAERFVIDLCATQKASTGIQPMIISLGEPKEILIEAAENIGVKVYCYKSNLLIKLLKFLFVLRKFDVVHIHSPHAMKFLSHLLPYIPAKIIYTRHGAGPLSDQVWLKLHQQVKNYVTGITFVSQEGSDIFHQVHGWPDVPSCVIDNGVLIKPAKSNKVKNTQLRIGSVGRMVALKNQIGLLKAIKLLSSNHKRDVELHFFGDGDCFSDLQTYQNANLTETDIYFHGMVNDREKIYPNLDVLVVCSETEGLSMVIIEAMANNIPVIATNVGGNPKLVIEGQTGWLFEYNDNEKLSEIIQGIISNRAIVNKLGTKAFSYINDNFSIKVSADKYADFYEK